MRTFCNISSGIWLEHRGAVIAELSPVDGQETRGSCAHICAACHGPDGRGQASNRVPRIAGQHYPYLRRQVEEVARLHRDLAPPEMTSALRGMREPEKDALADYISRLGGADALVDPNRPPRP